MKVVCIIPARYGSHRFPGKPLTMLAGRPLIQHVYGRASRSKRSEEVLVATDDERILRCVEGFGGKARMTSKGHRTGTDRVAEVARSIPCDIIVNVQGDEPLIDPGAIDGAVELLMEDSQADMGTLRFPIGEEELLDPNLVKVVTDARGYALYFSRAPIPFLRDRGPLPRNLSFYGHVGLYSYRRPVLLKLAEIPPSPLEEAERLEQLRALEAGFRIKVGVTNHRSIGVDTPEDLKRVEELIREGA